MKLQILALCGFLLGAHMAWSDSADYLPLAAGKKWVLRSPAIPEAITIAVDGQKGEAYHLKFDTPWAKPEMVLLPKEGKYYLTEITMNGQTVSPPQSPLYFDMTASENSTWTNEIGSLTVVDRSKTVKTPDRTYTHCVQIRQIGKEGEPLSWTFAPGVGFVQFGEGEWAFLLDGSASTPPSPAADGGAVRIGLSSNPFANEPFTPSSILARFEQSIKAGVTFLHLSPKWNEMEPQPGQYDFKDIDPLIALATRYNLPVACNLRIVDTNQRSMPADLEKLSFRDPKVQKRLFNLIETLMPQLKNRAKLMMVGNEIDPYFAAHQSEVADYKDLYVAASKKIKSLEPGIEVSTAITFGGLPLTYSLLKPLIEISDFLAVTYYPLNPDFTFRDPDTAGGDLFRIIAAAQGKKVLLQEVGYATSALNNSSQEKQAQFFSNVFKSLKSHSSAFWGANFFLMSDLSDSLVNTFAQYYKLPNADRFKSFLKTLGMFDENGNPKKSWEVFCKQAPLMKEAARSQPEEGRK